MEAGDASVDSSALPACHQAAEQAPAARESPHETKHRYQQVEQGPAVHGSGRAKGTSAAVCVSYITALTPGKARLNEDKLISLLQDAC